MLHVASCILIKATNDWYVAVVSLPNQPQLACEHESNTSTPLHKEKLPDQENPPALPPKPKSCDISEGQGEQAAAPEVTQPAAKIHTQEEDLGQL